MAWTPIEALTFAWPVIVLSQGHAGISNGGHDWGMATKHAVSNGYFRDMHIIDSAGKEYRVSDCELLQESFWRRPKTPLGRMWRIAKYQIEECDRPTFDDVRSRVVGSVTRNADWWEAGLDADELLRRLKMATDLTTLMDTLAAKYRT